MRKLRPFFLMAILFLADQALAFAAILSPEGYGGVSIGMTLAELRKVWPPYDAIKINPDDRTDLVAYGSDDPVACEQYEMGRDSGLVVMVEHGLVTRVTAYGPHMMTQKGVGVGDSEASVRKAYGRKLVRKQSPFADGDAHDLYLWSGPKSGIRFGIDYRGKVAFIHAGGESIGYEEGCL